MARDDDDAALSWDGDEAEPVVVERPKRAAPVDTEPEGDDVAPATSSIQLVTYGILAGAYLLYTVGWGISVARTGIFNENLFVEIMSQFSEFLAIAVAPLWFAITLLLTRGRRPLLRLLWLIAGLVLLVPLPFILGGA